MAEDRSAACPYCGEPKDEHSWASPTFCSLGGFPPVRIENDKRATDDQPAADSRRPHKIGWRSVSTGKLWIVPPGHMPAEYDVGPEWEPIYVLA